MRKHCCLEMARNSESTCDEHPDRFDCPDCLVAYSARRKSFGLIVHDGGSSSIAIRFCPWCGTELEAV